MKPAYTVISTFAGCGGSSLGYHKSGGQVLAAIEYDKHASQCYQHNNPQTIMYNQDIKQINPKKLLNDTGLDIGELDILDGSPPCQGFSTCNNHRKPDDPRNPYYKEYNKILKTLKPKTFIFENVPGLIQNPMKPIYKDIIKTLQQTGYNTKTKILNSKYYNCPTSRPRLIIIGVRKDLKTIPTHPQPETKPIPVIKAIHHLENLPYKQTKEDSYSRYLKPGQRSKDAFFPTKAQQAYKLDPYKPCPTITKRPLLYHYNKPRKLRWQELSTIQTFTYKENNYKWIGTPYQIIQRIGNSVPPNLMEAISRHVYKTIITKT